MAFKLPRTPAQFRRPLKTAHGDIFGPPQHTNWVDEECSWKETCYIGNWSQAVPALRYTGPDVLKLFSDCTVNSMNNFQIGNSKHIIHTNKDGKVIEEGILTRVGEEEFIAYSTFWADYWRRNNGTYNVEMEFLNVVSYHVQGPTSLRLLEKMTGKSLRHMKFMRNEDAVIAGIEVRILRQGMSGEVGFEIHAASEDGQKLWDAIVEVGQEFGIRQMGGRVAMLNHLQASYPTYILDYLPAMFDEDGAGYIDEMSSNVDFADSYYGFAGSFDSENLSDWYRSPIELGWANRINFDHSFRGDAALKAELAAGPKRKLCILRWNAEDVIGVYAEFFKNDGPLPDFMEMPMDPRGYIYSDQVLKDGKLVGATSSRGYSAHFREMISHAVIDIELAEPGTELTVLWGAPGTPQRKIRAVTASSPYKENRGRVDLNTLD